MGHAADENTLPPNPMPPMCATACCHAMHSKQPLDSSKERCWAHTDSAMPHACPTMAVQPNCGMTQFTHNLQELQHCQKTPLTTTHVPARKQLWLCNCYCPAGHRSYTPLYLDPKASQKLHNTMVKHDGNLEPAACMIFCSELDNKQKHRTTPSIAENNAPVCNSRIMPLPPARAAAQDTMPSCYWACYIRLHGLARGRFRNQASATISTGMSGHWPLRAEDDMACHRGCCLF